MKMEKGTVLCLPHNGALNLYVGQVQNARFPSSDVLHLPLFLQGLGEHLSFLTTPARKHANNYSIFNAKNKVTQHDIYRTVLGFFSVKGKHPHLRCEQSFPVNVRGQTHLKVAPLSKQTPPCLHGFGTQFSRARKICLSMNHNIVAFILDSYTSSKLFSLEVH